MIQITLEFHINTTIVMSRNSHSILPTMKYLYKNSSKISQIVLGINLGKRNIFMQ